MARLPWALISGTKGQLKFCAHRPECRDTSGTFTELPALNLKAHQGIVRRLIRKNGRKGQEGVAFCPIARKLAYITY